MVVVDVLLALTVALLVVRALALVTGSVLHRRGRRGGPDVGGRAPRVSVVVPAHDEEGGIEATVRRLRASDWPDLEVIVVDDGSTDRTLVRLRALEAELGLRVLGHSPNRGKAAALDRGVGAATGELIVTVDADTLVEPDAVRRLVAAFDDDRVAAVSGNVKVGDRSRWLGVWQSLEYVSCLNIERRALAWLGCVTTVPGAFGAYRRSALEAVGGFPSDTLAEDTDLSLSLLRAGYRIRYEDRARAVTEAPPNVRSLFRQRLRWLQGNLQCAWKHRAGLLTGPARLRLVGLPNFWFAHLFVFLLLPLSFVFLARARELFPSEVVAGLGGAFFGSDLLVVGLAYALDGEARRELAHAPLQRVLWPLFLWVVFAAVLVRLARGEARWTRAERVGT